MIPKKGVLICFTGIDGSGKSTHAISVANFLSQDNVKCKYVWTRWIATSLKPIVVLIKKWLSKRKISDKNYIEYKSAKRRYLRKSLARIWQNIVLFDYFLRVLVKIEIPLLFGNVLVCDRYLYDTLVDLAVDSSYSKGQSKNMLNMYITLLFPKPDVVFLLDVPEEVALKRKGDIPALTYLIDRRNFYLALAEEYPYIKVLDNSGDFNETQGKIRNEVCKILSLNFQSRKRNL